MDIGEKEGESEEERKKARKEVKTKEETLNLNQNPNTVICNSRQRLLKCLLSKKPKFLQRLTVTCKEC